MPTLGVGYEISAENIMETGNWNISVVMNIYKYIYSQFLDLTWCARYVIKISLLTRNCRNLYTTKVLYPKYNKNIYHHSRKRQSRDTLFITSHNKIWWSFVVVTLCVVRWYPTCMGIESWDVHGVGVWWRCGERADSVHGVRVWMFEEDEEIE